jgi:hypothetical protein
MSAWRVTAQNGSMSCRSYQYTGASLRRRSQGLPWVTVTRVVVGAVDVQAVE